MNTFRLRHQPGRVHIVHDQHGNPVIAVTLPNGHAPSLVAACPKIGGISTAWCAALSVRSRPRTTSKKQ